MNTRTEGSMRLWTRPSVLLILASAGAGVGVRYAGAAVIVQQVEADLNGGNAGDLYSPVEFNGASTVTSGGITYHAMSTTVAPTYSSHADTVANRVVSYAAGAVNTFYNQDAGDYLSDKGGTSYTGGTGGYGLVPVPAATANGIKVVNNSWIANGSDAASTYRYIRTLEYLTARDDMVMTSGAVTDYNSSLVWGQRNGIAVRGSQTFNPSSTYVANTRKHADVWGPVSDIASFTTPQVAGVSAQLIQRAINAGQADGQHHEVVKSILMTGASKTATDAYFTAWTRDLPNNLDIQDGAGRVDANKSYSIFDAGKKSFTALTSLASGTTISAPTVTSANQGWGYITSISELQSTAVIFHQAQSFTDLTATLAWDVTPPTQVLHGTNPPSGTYIDAGADQLANLDLTLYSITYSNGVYKLGSPVSGMGLSSASTDDNVEHLYYTGTLPAGDYAFVASYVDTPSLTGYSTDAGFSYQFTSVPEPAIAGSALVCLVGLFRWRRS